MLNRCKQYQQLTQYQFICNCIFWSTVSYHRIVGYWHSPEGLWASVWAFVNIPTHGDPTAHDVTRWVLHSLWGHSTQLISVCAVLGWMIGLNVGGYLTVTSIGKVMVASILPYPNHTTCKYRHSTCQHRLMVGFVSVQALPLFFSNRSNVGLN